MGIYTNAFQAALLCGALIGTQAGADAFSGDEIRQMFFEPKGDVSYPVCEHNGQNIEYREASLVEMLHGRGQAVAFAAADADGPYIMVNSELLSSAAPEFVEFALRHECKHHQNGHIDDFSRAHYADREEDADCTAIRELKEEGFSLEDLSIVEAYNVALVQAFYPASEKENSAQTRNAEIRACYTDGAEEELYSLETNSFNYSL